MMTETERTYISSSIGCISFRLNAIRVNYWRQEEGSCWESKEKNDFSKLYASYTKQILRFPADNILGLWSQGLSQNLASTSGVAKPRHTLATFACALAFACRSFKLVPHTKVSAHSTVYVALPVPEQLPHSGFNSCCMRPWNHRHPHDHKRTPNAFYLHKLVWTPDPSGQVSGKKPCLIVSWMLECCRWRWWGKERHISQPAFEFY